MKNGPGKSRDYFVLTSLIFVAAAGAGRADIAIFTESFDTAASMQTNFSSNPPPVGVRYDFATAAQEPTTNHSTGWAAADANASGISGSAVMSWTWDHADDGDGSVAFTIDLFPSAVTNAASLSFDIMVDPSSAADAYGGYGYFQVATRDGNYRTNQVGAFSLELGNPYYDVPIPGQWWHVSITGLSGVNTNIRALTFEDFNGSDRNINGQVIIYVDNVTLYKAGTPVPPDISIAQVTATGLYLTSTTNSTVDAPQSEHEGIRATNTAFGWVGGGANKISYSATIASYPGAQYTNYGSYIFLVHGAATGPNPDWTETNVVWLDIEGKPDGSATGALRYKVNDAGTNDQYAGSGYLGTVTNINGPLGTWSVTFTNNDYVVVRAPGGKTLAAHLALGSGLSSFAGPLSVYLGAEPNSTNNTGQTVVFSQFSITSNSIVLLSDNFSGPTLGSQWALAAEDPAGVLQVPAGTLGMVSWNLPDAGFRFVATTDLSSPNNDFDPGLPETMHAGRRTVLIPNIAPFQSNAFFFLVNP